MRPLYILALTTAGEAAALVAWFAWECHRIDRVSDRITHDYGPGVPGTIDEFWMKVRAAQDGDAASAEIKADLGGHPIKHRLLDSQRLDRALQTQRLAGGSTGGDVDLRNQGPALEAVPLVLKPRLGQQRQFGERSGEIIGPIAGQLAGPADHARTQAFRRRAPGFEPGLLHSLQGVAELIVEKRIALDDPFRGGDLLQEQKHAGARPNKGVVPRRLMDTGGCGELPERKRSLSVLPKPKFGVKERPLRNEV